jgi:hypothetical protein
MLWLHLVVGHEVHVIRSSSSQWRLHLAVATAAFLVQNAMIRSFDVFRENVCHCSQENRPLERC